MTNILLNPGAHIENKIIQYCLDHGVLSQHHIDVAQQERKDSPIFLGKVFLDLGFLNHAQMHDIFSKATGYGLFHTKDAIDVSHHENAIIARHKDSIHIGVQDPTDLAARDQIAQKIQEQHQDMPLIWTHHYDDFKASNTECLNADILESIMNTALQKNASDIHITPGDVFWKIKYRINGALTEPTFHHSENMQGVLIRLKIQSQLDIAQTHKPQSGAMIWKNHNNGVHARISTHPCLNGENIAIRLLHVKNKRLKINDLGLNTKTLNHCKSIIHTPSGVIIIAGPTGSGKTTTLYAILDHLHEHGAHILTLEDPIESHLPYAVQTEVSEHLNYADGIKSIMRQDPDVILIGEIRDAETAHMAMRAAMTGHLVLTTLHGDSVAGVFNRLLDFGISQTLIDQFLTSILIQKLTPVPCPHKTMDEKNICKMCNGSGVRGRTLSTTFKSYKSSRENP